MNDVDFVKRGKEIYETINAYKSFHIWGTGKAARILFLFMQRKGIIPQGFIVSDGHRKEAVFQGISVYENSELQNKNKCCVFVAVHGGQAIVDEHKNEYGHIEILDDVKDIGALYALEAMEYFVAQGIDVSKEYLTFSNWKMLNPFLSDWKYRWAWLTEYVDMILPTVFQRYDCINEGPYELGEVKIQEGDVVLDCGANIGMFSSYCMARGAEKCICFEPVPEVIEYLNKNIDGEKAICARYAVSNNAGKAVFQLLEDVITAGTLMNEKQENTIEVDVITIDEYVEREKLEKVDFIKADIEGAERDMLRGGAKTIRKFLPKIAICTYHLPDDPEVLESIIKGYSEKYVVEHHWKKLYAYVPDSLPDKSNKAK